MRSVLPLVSLSALLLAAGCGGATPSTVHLDCTTPPAPLMQYPSDKLTGVPDGNFTMVLSFSGSPAAWTNLSVSTPNGGSVSSASVGPLQDLSSPLTPQPPGTTAEGAAIGPLLQAKTYTVSMVYQPPSGCVPAGSGTLPLHVLGTFTTQ